MVTTTAMINPATTTMAERGVMTQGSTGITDGPTSSPSVDNVTSAVTSNDTLAPTTTVYSTSVSTVVHTTTQAPGETGLLPLEAIVAIAVGGAVLLIIFLIICVVLIVRKHKNSLPLPAPLPRLTPNGLPREDSSCTVFPIIDKVRASGDSLGQHTPDTLLDDVVVENAGENHSLSHSDYVDSGGEECADNDDYVNVESRDSDIGLYITPISTRPDSMPTTIAPGFHDHHPPFACSREESMYIAMGSSTIAEQQEDLEGIYTPPDEGESEPVYSAPNEAPTPCLPSARWAYVNIPEYDGRSQQEHSPEQGDGSREEEYINLCSPRHVYCNFFQDRFPSKKSKVTRSESLKSMGTRSYATEAELSPRDFLPSLSAEVDKGRGASIKLHKAASMSQVLSSFSSKPRISKRIPDPILDNSSGSDSERENYENLKDRGSQAHYRNVLDWKAELESEGKFSNIASAEQTLGTVKNVPVTGTNRPNNHGTRLEGVGNLSKSSDEDQCNMDNPTQGVRDKVRTLNSKQGIAGLQPRTVSNKPEKVSNKLGTLSNSKARSVNTKPGTVSINPGSVNTKPGTVSSIPRRVSAKPVIVAQKPGRIERTPESAGTKPGTVSGIPRSVGTNQGRAGLKPGGAGIKPESVGIKPGFLSGKPCVGSKPLVSVSTKPGGASNTPGGAQPGVKRGEKDKKGGELENSHTSELMQVLAKRRHNDGEN